MTEQPPAPRSKRMVGFYVGAGVLLALLVAFYFAWTPLRIWYWEREVASAQGRDAPFLATPTGSGGGMSPKAYAACRLLQCGPASLPALDRLLRSPHVVTREAVLEACGNEECPWTLPLLVDYAACAEFTVTVHGAEAHALTDYSGDARCASAAIWAAEEVAGRKFSNPWHTPIRALPAARKKLLAWWEKEGKAKYGRGGE